MSSKIEELIEKLAEQYPNSEHEMTVESFAYWLQKNAAPVVERQPLSVWEGSMPESNGKSNFTVILHTGDIAEGICVYRSEYPDRARYEADCFRHLIGDAAFPEKPFILDYDTDKHSGYVKPDTAPPELAELQATIDTERKTRESAEGGWREANRVIAIQREKLDELQSEIERLKGGQGEPVAWPDYNYQGMGCGLEDRGITDRYEACRYGFDSAIDKCAELGELYASQLSQASVALPGKMGERSDFPSAYRRYAKGWNACLDKVKEMNQ